VKVSRVIAVALGVGVAVFAAPAARAFTHSGATAVAIAIAAGALAGLGYARALRWTDHAPLPPVGLRALSAVAAITALVAFARLAIFIVDPSQVELSTNPDSKFSVHHNCATAYFVAAKASATSPDPYADSLYTARDDDPTKIRKPLTIGPFNVDVFEYPPPFLLLPRALRLLTPEFQPFRMLWFGLSGAFILTVMVVTARLLGPVYGMRALLLVPLAWLFLPMIDVAQKENIQATIIAMSVLGMILLDRRRFATGGALLGFASVAKLYPGLLVVYLAVRRDWRALVWTAAFGALYAVAAAIDIGPAVYRSFAHHMPGLLGGEAFPAFRNPAAIAINLSIPGLVFKAKLFGLAGAATFANMKFLGWIYTLVAIAGTVVLARRATLDDEKPMVWLAVLILATLRSPFLPMAYAAVPAGWLLTLIAARYEPSARVLAATLAAWGALGIMLPTDTPLGPQAAALISLVPQSGLILIAALVLQGRFRRREQEARFALATGA
jgi:alpha-1,2-mannosyltransferase